MFKIKDEVLININGQVRRAVVRKRHRDRTITIEGLSGSGPMIGREIRVLSCDLVLVTYPNLERAAKLDAERQKSKISSTPVYDAAERYLKGGERR